MDLKEFVLETVSAIIEATKDLNSKYASQGVVMNPPSSGSSTSDESFEEGNYTYRYRRVQNIQFDVAVTASNSTAGAGKAGIKVWGFEGSADGTHARTNEQVSRISFAVPLSFPASQQEKDNLLKLNSPQRPTGLPKL